MSRFDTPRALLAVGCLLASVASRAPKRWRALLATALLAVIGATLWLPSPTLAAPDSCPFSGGGAPYAFQSWEADRDRSLYLDAQRLAAHNELFPDDKEFALPTLKVGTGSARREDPLAAIPAPLLFAIGWVESSINQTAIGVHYGSTGPALISFDCGYGIMQITSKILNDGDPPTRFEALVGTHFAYNIAAGAQVLAEAWNEEFFPVVGDADPVAHRVLVLRALGLQRLGAREPPGRARCRPVPRARVSLRRPARGLRLPGAGARLHRASSGGRWPAALAGR